MKKHQVYHPFRISAAALALGVSGFFVYQLSRQPVKPTSVLVGSEISATQISANQKAGAALGEGSPASILNAATAQDVPPSHVAPSLFKEFNDWAVIYSKASPADQQKMLTRGDAMVKQRQEKMADLIKQDPELALLESDALSPLARQALPDALKQQLEQRVNVLGDLEVLACVGGTAQPYVRSTTFDGEKYIVYPEGRNETLLNESNRSLLGIRLAVSQKSNSSAGDTHPKVERVMALRKDRVRTLSKEEGAVILKSRGNASKEVCSISTKPIGESKTAVVIESGGVIKSLCKPSHGDQWLTSPAGLAAAGRPSGIVTAGGPGEGTGGLFPPVPEGKSTGNKSFLCVKFRCQDQPDTLYQELETNLPQAFSQLNTWSYGKINFNRYVISPLLVLPRTFAEYKSGKYNVDNDAWAMVAKLYNRTDYSFTAICVWGLWDYGGATWMLDTRIMINYPSAYIFQHEIGHCLGLPHANFWKPSTTNPIGPGIWDEYGGSYDSMGHQWASFGTMNRFYTRWLTLAETHNLDSRVSGTYTIYDPDVKSLTPGRKYLIRVPLSSGGYYFVEFRPRPCAFSNQEVADPTTQNGVRVLRSNDAGLLDVTPLSSGGQYDAALLAGADFYDAGENIRIKAVAKGGSGSDQYFSVAVTFANTTAIASGHTYLIRSIESNKPFGVTSNPYGDGGVVSRMSSDGSQNQKWVLMKVDTNNYKIVNVNSRKVLEVGGYSTSNGGLVQQWDYAGIPSQKWQIVETGGGSYKLINSGSGLALSAPPIISSTEQQLQQYTYIAASNQKWALDEVNPLVSGANYAIAARHSDQVINLPSFNTNNGTLIQQFPWYSASNQKWTASSQGGSQLAFTGLYSQKVLEVGGYAMGEGASIKQWSWAGIAWQKWTLVAVEANTKEIWFAMVNVGSGKVIDVPNASTIHGMNLQQYTLWNGANQQWRFVKQ